MRGPQVFSGQSERPPSVARLFHLGEHCVPVFRVEEAGDVLDENPAGSEFPDDPVELEPETASLRGVADLEASKDVKEPIPPEAFDKHTVEGKKRLQAMGWSEKQMTEQFILKETKALKPYHEGEFHQLVEGIVDLGGR